MDTTAEPTSARVPIDPRIRQRRIEVQRAAGRRRLRILIVGLGVLGAGLAAYGLTRSPLLDVDAVYVRGAAQTPAAEVVAAAGLDGKRQMTDLDPRQTAARVEALPWVARADVHRDWPGAVQISVVERRPIGLVMAPSGVHFAYVDAHGQILDHAPGKAEELPVIAGALEVPAPGHHVEGLDDALRVLTALGDEPAVAEVHVEGDEVLAVLQSGAHVRFGPMDELAAKVTALRTLIARVDVGSAAVIDVRVPSAPALTRR